MPFDFRLSTRIVFGPGRLSEVGALAAGLDVKRALVVSDPGIVAVGHAGGGIESLQAAGLAVELFDGVEENPTTAHVDAGLAFANRFEPDVIVGIGGGSSMDCAKGINFLYSCGGRMQDYRGIGKASGPMLAMIAVPTTAGTGSETQSFALISDAETHVKMACGDRRAAFRIAILDPELTRTQPARVTALTGIDAIAHAVETLVTKRRNAISHSFSREAWRHLARNYARVLANPDDLVARAEMQLGAMFAGLAIENSMLGAGHALANPLTATCRVPHGEAVALMLPHVVRFNAPACAAQYGELFTSIPSIVAESPAPPDDGVELLVAFLEDARCRAGLAVRLSDRGVERDRIPGLAADAAKQWTAQFNPRDITETDMRSLYEQAF